MIQNDLEYEVTKKWADQFTKLAVSLRAARDIHEILLKAQIEAAESQAEELYAAIGEYEELRKRPTTAAKPD